MRPMRPFSLLTVPSPATVTLVSAVVSFSGWPAVSSSALPWLSTTRPSVESSKCPARVRRVPRGVLTVK